MNFNLSKNIRRKIYGRILFTHSKWIAITSNLLGFWIIVALRTHDHFIQIQNSNVTQVCFVLNVLTERIICNVYTVIYLQGRATTLTNWFTKIAFMPNKCKHVYIYLLCDTFFAFTYCAVSFKYLSITTLK